MGGHGIRLGLSHFGLSRLLALLPRLRLRLLHLAVCAGADGGELGLQRCHGVLVGVVVYRVGAGRRPVQTFSLGQEFREEVAFAGDLRQLGGGLLKLLALLLDDLGRLVDLQLSRGLALGARGLSVAEFGSEAAGEGEQLPVPLEECIKRCECDEVVGDHVAVRDFLWLCRRVCEAGVVPQGDLPSEFPDLVCEVFDGGLVRSHLLGQALRLRLGATSLLLRGITGGDGSSELAGQDVGALLGLLMILALLVEDWFLLSAGTHVNHAPSP